MTRTFVPWRNVVAEGISKQVQNRTFVAVKKMIRRSEHERGWWRCRTVLTPYPTHFGLMNRTVATLLTLVSLNSCTEPCSRKHQSFCLNVVHPPTQATDAGGCDASAPHDATPREASAGDPAAGFNAEAGNGPVDGAADHDASSGLDDSAVRFDDAWFERIRSEFATRADAIDLNGDGIPEWHLTRTGGVGPVVQEAFDADFHGYSELLLEHSDTGDWLGFDDNGDGFYEFTKTVTYLTPDRLSFERLIVEDTNGNSIPDYRQLIVVLTASSVADVTDEWDHDENGEYDESLTYQADTEPTKIAIESLPGTGDCSPGAVQAIEDAQSAAFAEGYACLSAIQPSLAKLVGSIAARSDTRMFCANYLASSHGLVCGRGTYGEVPLIAISEDGVFGQNCGSLPGTIFHEALHSILPLDPNHNSVVGNPDQVNGCEWWCFGDGNKAPQTNLCAKKLCSGGPTPAVACPAARSPCELDGCDPSTGDCFPPGTPTSDGTPCNQTFGLPCVEEILHCRNGVCEPNPIPNGTPCNIGQKDNPCYSGAACRDGACEPIYAPDGKACKIDDSDACKMPVWHCHSGNCEDDREASVQCRPDQFCQGGVCQCRPGQIECGSVPNCVFDCTNEQSRAGMALDASACTCSCPKRWPLLCLICLSEDDCAQSCVDTTDGRCPAF